MGKCAGYEVDADGVLIGHPDKVKRLNWSRTVRKTNEIEARSLTLNFYHGADRSIVCRPVLVIIRRKVSSLKAGRDNYAEPSQEDMRGALAELEKKLSGG